MKNNQKFAKVPSQYQNQGITWLRLSPSRGDDKGVFILLYKDITKHCDYDYWFLNIDEAFQLGQENYGVNSQDWITIEDVQRMGIEVVDEY